MYEITFGMIKPDAVHNKHIGDIISRIEQKGFEILELKKTTLSKDIAEKFYAIHNQRSFFGEMIEFITSGPVVLMALGKENAIVDWRTLMGATDPKKADIDTIRRTFCTDISMNAVHGSDAPGTAKEELTIFFPHLVK